MQDETDEAGTVAAREAASASRIEIVGDRRRAHSAAFRSRCVAEALVPGVRVPDVARRHGVCASLIYRWRREAVAGGEVGTGSAVSLLPVRIAAARKEEPARVPEPGVAQARLGSAVGMIEIELPDGIRVRVNADVNEAALRRVVQALRG